MAPPVRQSGRLGDLAEIPWGTPDADQLYKLLRDEYGAAALDRAAANRTLRQLCAEAPAAATLAQILDRPQDVRHAFRGELDWSDPAVTGVFHALLAVFDEDGSSEDVCRLARVDLTGIDLDRPAREVWAEVMAHAAHHGTLEKLIDQTLTDMAVGEHQDALETARDRPWRVVSPAPPPSSPRQGWFPPAAPAPGPAPTAVEARPSPAPPAPAIEPTPSESPEPVPRRGSPVLALLLGLAVVGGTLGALWYAASRYATPVQPASEVVGGTLDLRGARGRLILSRAGVDVATIPASSSFAFPAQPLDADGDGQIDQRWSVRLELTSSPCPSRPLSLRRDWPRAQRWSAPVARATEDEDGCVVTLSGLTGATVGSVVELDPGTVQPRRFAVVEEMDGDDPVARALGDWGSCAACWPALGSCADAADAVQGAADAELLVDRATCPESVTERLRARIPPPPPPPEPAAEEPPPEVPAPPPPKPAPRPVPKKRRHH
jgi:hypothetical protein